MTGALRNSLLHPSTELILYEGARSLSPLPGEMVFGWPLNCELSPNEVGLGAFWASALCDTR